MLEESNEETTLPLKLPAPMQETSIQVVEPVQIGAPPAQIIPPVHWSVLLNEAGNLDQSNDADMGMSVITPFSDSNDTVMPELRDKMIQRLTHSKTLSQSVTETVTDCDKEELEKASREDVCATVELQSPKPPRGDSSVFAEPLGGDSTVVVSPLTVSAPAPSSAPARQVSHAIATRAVPAITPDSNIRDESTLRKIEERDVKIVRIRGLDPIQLGLEVRIRGSD